MVFAAVRKQTASAFESTHWRFAEKSRFRLAYFSAIARSGGDPLADRRRVQSVPTFVEAAQRVLEQKRDGWRGRWHAQNWIRSMERYAFPRIGSRPVSEVNTADVLEILTPI